MVRIRHIFCVVCCVAVGLAGCLDSETHWGDNQQETQQNSDQTGDDNDGDNDTNDDNDAANQTNNGNDVEPPEPPVLAGPVQVIFEDTDPGDEATETIEFIAETDELVELDDVTIDGDDDAFTVEPFPDDWPDEVNPGDSFEIEATYSPEDTAEDAADLIVEWYDGDNEEITEVTLVGNAACLEPDVDTLDLRGVDAGESETKALEVESCAPGPFEFEPAVEYEGSAPDPDPFTIENEEDFPKLIEPGVSTTLEITYEPDDDSDNSDNSGNDDGDTGGMDDEGEAMLVISSPDSVLDMLALVQLQYRGEPDSDGENAEENIGEGPGD